MRDAVLQTLSAADDPQGLAQARKELLPDQARAQELADQGRQVVLERFTAERMAREFAEVCRMVAQGRDQAHA